MYRLQGQYYDLTRVMRYCSVFLLLAAATVGTAKFNNITGGLPNARRPKYPGTL